MSYERDRMIATLVIVSIVIVIGLALGPNGDTTDVVQKEELIKQFNLREDAEIIISKSSDVTGDGKHDKIFLTGNKVNGSNIFYDHLTVVVQSGSNYYKATYDQFSGYEPELIIKDFSGDKVGDLMVKAATGGSGGIVKHLIAAFKDDQLQIIFDNQNNQGVSVTGQFLPNFKAKLKFAEFNQEAIIDLSFNQEKYIKERIYNQAGQLVKRKLIRPYSYPFAKLKAIDYNNDGTYELKGYQRVVGAYGADAISRLESIWSYHDQKWQLRELMYSNYLLKYRPQFNKKPKIIGSIKEITTTDNGTYVLVKAKKSNSKGYNKIRLVVTEKTKILRQSNNNKLKVNDLKAGMKVRAYHRQAVTMSIPPQSAATKIIVSSNKN